MTSSRAEFERWWSEFVVRHPLLASGAKVLPGITVHDLVVGVAEEAWEAAQRGQEAPAATGAEVPPPAPPLHLVEPPASTKRPRGGAAWTPEQRAAQAERMRERWRTGRGAPYRRTMTDAELGAVADRAKSQNTP